MGNYEKEYILNWININPTEKRIEAEFKVLITLDTGEITELPKFNIKLVDADYENYYAILVTHQGKDIALGDLIFALLSEKVQKEFPEVQL